MGYVPALDCAPLAVAAANGSFERHGVRVRLSRESGWATLREKLLHGELDAALGDLGMAVSIDGGIGSAPRRCVVGLVTNLGGLAITLSRRLHRDARGRAAVNERNRRPLVFAYPFEGSVPAALLRAWLRSTGIDEKRDVRFVAVSGPLAVENLLAGHIDGYCGDEPWNAVASAREDAWCAATSGDIAPAHPGKALILPESGAATRRDEYVALIAALLEACRFCADAANRAAVATTLSRADWLDMSPSEIDRILAGTSILFHGDGVNSPGRDKASWIFEMADAGGAVRFDDVRRIFRDALFNEARPRQGAPDHAAEDRPHPGRPHLMGLAA